MGLESKQRIIYGPRGKGSIRVLPQSAESKEDWRELRITIVDNDGWKEVYSLDPQTVRSEFGTWQLKPQNDLFIELTKDEQDIRSIRPYDGTFLMRFQRFAARRDPETNEYLAPTIRHVESERITLPSKQSWVNPPHDKFFGILQIVGSEIGQPTEYDGLEAVKSLVYQFERDPQTGMTKIMWEKKFWYDQLINFLETTGFDFDADSLTPSENVLGELEEILQRRNQLLRGTFKEGWLQRDLEDAPIGVKVN